MGTSEESKRPKKRYLRILHEDLTASAGWKALTPLQQGEHLRQLVIQASLEGKLPQRWERVAQLREVGKQETYRQAKMRESKYEGFVAAWDAAWEEDRGERYVWTPKARSGIRKAWETAGGDLIAFQSRARAMLTHRNPWYRENASPNLIASHWNELGGGPKTARVQPPPMPRLALPRCAYCGHEQRESAACTHCKRPWRPATP